MIKHMETARFRLDRTLDSMADSSRHPIVSFLLAQAPALIMIVIAGFVSRYTDSGYSVIIITLLAAILYVSLRSGTVHGVISALLVVAYNFYLISVPMGFDLWTIETLRRGGVIATTFPVLAFIVGKLKERNDYLLQREKEARQIAEEVADQLHLLAETVPQKIYTMYPDGTTEYINSQWSGYVDESFDADPDRGWTDLFHPDDFDEAQKAWLRSLETGETYQFELRLKRLDGTYRWHLARAEPLRDQQGNIIKWVGSSTDIEDIRKTRKLEADTARLVRQREQLMELNSAKDEFISIASHQLRTPATGVKQYINMVLDGYAGDIPEAAKSFLKKADESNERQLSVINDLLQVAQADAGKVNLKKERIIVNDLIKNVINEQSGKFKKRHQRIRFEDPEKHISVISDPGRLRMVIENLIDNASKYSPEDTSVTVSAKSSRGQVRIMISDEGVGISPKDREKIFQKFVRVDNPLSTVVGGTGLGLYWVRKIISLHGGEVTAAPNPDKGSTFTVSLPTSHTA